MLAAADQIETPVYVVLTMRSDYLGDCSVFRGLPETLNGSQYLAPVLTRAQLQEAIEKPAMARGVEIAPDLTQRLLNDVGRGLEQELDQLPVLQHVLMRTWAEAAGSERVEMRRYLDAGGMTGALDQHADDLYNSLKDDRQRSIARKLFQRLTEKESQGCDIRRATSFGELARLSGGSREETLAVIEHFRGFLATAEAGAIRDDSIVDITHEALIRQWRMLRRWAAEEAEMARIYRRLADDAAQEDAEPWRGPRLAEVARLKKDEGWNETWARRYALSASGGEEYRRVEGFLVNSVRRQQRRRYMNRALAAALVLLAAGAYWFYFEQQKREIEYAAAVEQQRTEREAAEARLETATNQLHDSEALVKQLESAVADLRKLQEQARQSNDQELARALDRQRKEFEKTLEQSRNASKGYEGSVTEIGQELEKINVRPAGAVQQLAPELFKQAK